MNLKIDIEFQSLIPPPQTEDRDLLESQIIKDGCRDALVLWKGTIVDGHNRYQICTKHGLKFRTVSMKFADRTEAKVWIIRNQFARRNLADIDRVKLAVDLHKLIKPLADKSRREGNSRGGKGGGKSTAKLPKTSPVDTRKACAKAAGVGDRTYDAGRMILEAAKTGEVSKKVVNAIRRKEKSIHGVVKDLKESRQKKKRAAKRKKAVKAMPKTALDNIHVGDSRKLSDVVPDGSLSLIFTDPPYDKKSVELYDGLGKFAADKLCEGGSLLCYVGQTQLPLAMDHLWEHLRYWWTVCCLHSGGANLMSEYGSRPA